MLPFITGLYSPITGLAFVTDLYPAPSVGGGTAAGAGNPPAAGFNINVVGVRPGTLVISTRAEPSPVATGVSRGTNIINTKS